MPFRLKSLRHRVLLLFAILALGPLLALGGVDYVNARRAVERIIEDRTEGSATRAAELIDDRYAILQSDALTLTGNSETQALFVAIAAGDSAAILRARAAADTFARAMWTITNGAYQSIELRDSSDLLLLRLPVDSQTVQVLPVEGGLSGRQPVGQADSIQSGDDNFPPMSFPVTRAGVARPVGRLILRPRVAAIMPAQLGALRFGNTGYLLVVDSLRRVVFDSRTGAATLETFGPPSLPLSGLMRTDGHALVKYLANDSARIAAAQEIPGTGWTVLSTTAVAEFTTGLESARFLSLLVVVAIAAGVGMLFWILVGRATRSLEELTVAVRRVGQGDLSPQLPVATDDEIGTLSGAFDQMLGRVRAMMREIEVSRQLAVLGEFSAQLSHEIRNPLTSLKLNLQGLSRDVQRGALSGRAGPSLEICLREVNRLDGVVRGVLELARPRAETRAECGLHAVLDQILAVHGRRLDASGIAVIRETEAARDNVCGNQEQLVGLFTNLVVNAIEAQPDGGRLLIRTQSNGVRIKVLIADDGPGVPNELADRIFRPFVSAKTAGTGLGLPMALNVARDHAGSLELVRTPEGFAGAAFRVTLPLA